MSLVSYELLYTFMWCAIVIGIGAWGLWELYSLWRHRGDRDVLPPPRMDRICRGGRDAWIVSSSTIKGDYK